MEALAAGLGLKYLATQLRQVQTARTRPLVYLDRVDEAPEMAIEAGRLIWKKSPTMTEKDQNHVSQLSETIKELEREIAKKEEELEKLGRVCGQAYRNLAIATSAYISLAKILGERDFKALGIEIPQEQFVEKIYPELWSMLEHPEKPKPKPASPPPEDF